MLRQWLAPPAWTVSRAARTRPAPPFHAIANHADLLFAGPRLVCDEFLDLPRGVCELSVKLGHAALQQFPLLSFRVRRVVALGPGLPKSPLSIPQPGLQDRDLLQLHPQVAHTSADAPMVFSGPVELLHDTRQLAFQIPDALLQHLDPLSSPLTFRLELGAEPRHLGSVLVASSNGCRKSIRVLGCAMPVLHGICDLLLHLADPREVIKALGLASFVDGDRLCKRLLQLTDLHAIPPGGRRQLVYLRTQRRTVAASGQGWRQVPSACRPRRRVPCPRHRRHAGDAGEAL
mmetsp:Transcript_42280/g.122215  ORF Transcript_42280/g.122215 Transcript_42280/m.122215 type:complete len:289 (-) Transcript_42280:8-874(-)